MLQLNTLINAVPPAPFASFRDRKQKHTKEIVVLAARLNAAPENL